MKALIEALATGLEEAISDKDIWDVLRSVKVAGGKTRDLKDSAWKRAVQSGWITLSGGYNGKLSDTGLAEFERLGKKNGWRI